jgi:YVTN family beta-propeller protein
MHNRVRLAAALAWAAVLAAGSASAQPSFVAFESGPVRPLALSPSGALLYAVNTPDNRLEVFTVNAAGLTRYGSVPVGMEPVAVAARANGEVWVVNHLSDSVSIVDVATRRVKRTLLVGDEPRDIVITDPDGPGPLGERVFITTAHRGQHRTHPSLNGVPGAGDPQLTTEGVPRADVWVFDADDLDQGAPNPTLGGVPNRIVELFGDTPRALAVSPDGGTVYAAVFHSGNQTAVVSEGMVCNGFDGAGPCGGDGVTSPNGLASGALPGGNPGPSANLQGIAAPEVGLVVQFDNTSGEWRDELGRNWSNGIRFFLPDHDVFEIDAASLSATVDHEHVGTILFNMAVNPVSGNVYVSNTEAQNLTRFEGPGGAGSTVQGNLAQARITVITQPGGAVNPRHLNKHIDYGVLPAPAGTKDHSLATPLDMVVSSDGATLYVAAFGSSKVGVFATASLENDSFDPTVESANYLSVSGGGPGGLALDEIHDRLYVLTRFDNSVSVLDLATGAERNHIPLHNPEPPEVVNGRPVLYDAFGTSSNGEASCSSCHIFGDFDSLAWDLGDPEDDVRANPIPINLEAAAGDQNGGAATDEFHPMKGPMTTQTLRGLANSGGMHWRGDRTNGFFGVDPAIGPPFDAELSFNNFIVAFAGLVGGDTPPTDPGLQADMQKFTDFQLRVTLPPNPIRNLDNSLTSAQLPGKNLQAGLDFFLGNDGPDSGGGDGHRSDGVPVFGGLGFTCEGCHSLDPLDGFFGTDGIMSFENETQIMKIPHMRNMYQKVGMFGMPNVEFNNPGDNAHKGDQVRGTGFLHDGSTDTLFRFLTADVFEFQNILGFTVGFAQDPVGLTQRQDVEAFALAFDTDVAPIVGQQVTLDASSDSDVDDRIDLMIARAGTSFPSQVLGGFTTECDLVVKATLGTQVRGWLLDTSTGLFQSDRSSEAPLSDTSLRLLADTAGQGLTYTAVPPGSGVRMGIDRDEDGALDGDERVAGTDPANPGSFVGACSDGLDNDGDGAVDFGGDDGCFSLGWNIENPACSDGYDNDNDGLADAADPQCAGSPWRKTEKGTRRCGLLGLEPLLALGFLRWIRRRSRPGTSLRGHVRHGPGARPANLDPEAEPDRVGRALPISSTAP